MIDVFNFYKPVGVGWQMTNFLAFLSQISNGTKNKTPINAGRLGFVGNMGQKYKKNTGFNTLSIVLINLL